MPSHAEPLLHHPTSASSMLLNRNFLPNLPQSEATRPVSLTPRQQDVLRLLMRGGASNKVIARTLGIQEGTVKIHVAAILRALRCRNRTEAVIAAHAFAAIQGVA